MKFGIFPKQPQPLAIVRQCLVAGSASLSFLACGTVIAWPSPIVPMIVNQETPFHMNNSQVSWMVSLLYVGNIVTPFPARYLANECGRKITFLLSGLLLIISWLLILFNGPSNALLFFGRFLAGLYFGLILTVQPIYIKEISQTNIQDKLCSLNHFMFSAGSFLTLVLGTFVSYHTLAAISLVIPITFMLTIWFIPESPYYSLTKGQCDSARESLFWLRGDINRIELELELDQIERFVQNQLSSQDPIKDIFSKVALKKAVLLSIIFTVLKCMVGRDVIQAFATSTLPEKTFQILTPNYCMIIVGVISLLSSMLAPFIAGKFDHKPLLVISFSACSLATLTITVWLLLDCDTKQELNQNSFIPFLSFVVHSFFYNLLLGPIGDIVLDKMFPTEVKIKSHSNIVVAMASTSFIFTNSYLNISNWLGMYCNYLILSINCFIGIWLTILYVPETRKQTIEEIQDWITGTERKKISTPVLFRTMQFY